MDQRRILVIAGSDSSGGAGLEADQKVIATHACYAMTATTALTCQNTLGVRGIHQVPPDFVTSQIDAVIEDVGVDAIKIGMLASAQTVEAVVTALQRHRCPRIVLDPVMVATSGAQLLPDQAVTNLREHFLPLATILTPNLSEACLLLDSAGIKVPDVRCVDDLVDLAGQVQALGARYVLVKGGHLPLTKSGQISEREAEHHTVLNVLHDGHNVTLYSSDYVTSKNTHGTGCSLASAIACQMVLDPSASMADQVKVACQYVDMAIRTGVDLKLGHGSGPINHFHSMTSQSSLQVKTFSVDSSKSHQST